jgi:hypothetical protein
MSQIFVNNFSTTVAQTFGSTDTTLTLASVVGLPTIPEGDYLLLTVFRQTGVDEREHEVVKVTSRVGNACVVERAIEGAAASLFISGDRVQARITAGTFNNAAADATAKANAAIASFYATAATYTYDAAGKIIGLSETVSGSTRTTTISYNPDGTVDRVITAYNNATRTETYTYTAGVITGLTVS